jgi:hypothetical protein
MLAIPAGPGLGIGMDLKMVEELTGVKSFLD